ncbi:uncharacterized protein A4U43_C01F5400 [Asparagus officinalis]|uniref:Uncharacterized protein n=2 Tax=Asparagus officinalis TaxID=4686 RepID=A0A5P1FNP5_ASPOF|nr:uncharacterized protein A4U43_C01F5400 [Asparagus officinalis]
MLALCAYFPTYITKNSSSIVDKIDIPGLRTIPSSSLPPPLRDPEHLFRIQFVENGQALTKADGILVNTFQALEPEALSALNAGHVAPDLPPVFAIGPLCNPLRSEKRTALSWLDEQPEDSVVYVSFGSRTAMAAEQIEELADGLERSGQRFLWVLKTKKVDKEEEQYG